MALRLIETDIRIDAPAEAVWGVLSDLERWPEWHPFVVSVRGVLEPGKTVVLTKGAEERTISVRQKVLSVEPGVEFRLGGSLGVRGLLDNEHRFRVESLAEDRAHFIHGQAFRGLLVRLLIRKRGGASYEVFERINAALKERVESG